MKLPSRIILVEDDAVIREGLSEFLESEGFQVFSAENGLKGLELIRQLHGACVVLLDLQMPVMTGEQLLDALKQETDPAVRDVPVLVLTARGEGFSHPGTIGFIRKPLDLDALLTKVTAIFKTFSI